MPDYIMRWLASRFLDTDAQEELGILTPAVRARKAAQEVAQSVAASDTAGPEAVCAGVKCGIGASARRRRAPSPTPRRWSRPGSRVLTSARRAASAAG